MEQGNPGGAEASTTAKERVVDPRSTRDERRDPGTGALQPRHRQQASRL